MKQVKGLLHIVMMCGIVAGVHAQSTTTTLEFQDGMDGYAGTRDTKLLSDSPTTAWGTTINHAVDGDPDKSTLVLWDLSAIPAGAVALSAEVQLFVNNETADTYYVHQMTAPWDEAAATWENASSGTAWSAPGAAADHAPDTLAMVGPAVFGYVTFEVPAAVVQAWLDDPESNQGLIFKNYDDAADGMEFDSRENANRGHRPKLTLTYEGDPPPPPVDGASGAQRFRLAWRDDPATTMVVGWDQARGDGAMLCYDTVDHGSELQGAGCAPYALSHGVDVVHDYKGMNNSFARLTGLQPNTVYYFVVRDNLGTSERYSFRTSPATPDVPFTFIAGGDSRTNILDPVPIDQENRAARRRANEMVAKLAPLFVAFNGDMTMKSSAEQWQDWMDDWQLTVRDSDNRLVPIIPGVGDHERFHERLTWLEGADLDRLFDVANPDGFYHYTFGGDLLSHYSLNIKLSPDDEFFGTEVAWNAQTEWLRGELEADAATWKVVQYQDPMRPVVNSKEDRQDSYEAWAQLFYENDVQLVTESDAHNVNTTWPLRPTSNSAEAGYDAGFVRDQTGTTYVGAGGWGAPLRPCNNPRAWTRACDSFYQIKWVGIDGTKRMEVRTVKTDSPELVGTVDEATPLAEPAGLDVWTPANGTGRVLIIRTDGAIVSTTVTSSEDDGPGSLRAVLSAAPEGETIRFASTLDGQAITLATPLSVDRPLVLDAEGLDVTLRAGSAGPALDVTSALTLRGVTVEGVNEGTTAISNAGTLTMDLTKAGAVINAGTLNARFSTLAALTNSGDATLERAFTGAVSNTGTLTLRTSTLYTTDDLGVGLQGGSFIAENATIVAEEQGVQVAGGVARLYSSLVVAPTPVSDTFDDDGFNLLVTSLDEAGLNVPADNDGNVPTMALAVGSPAVDAGDCSMSSVNTDARGYGRPLNIRGYPNAADGCDIGALEAAVIDVQRTAPVAQFSTTPPDGIAPLAVRFDASATTDAENDIVQFAWEFGDGDSESGERVTHTYRAPGTYTVKLVVTDASGLEGTASSNVVVEEAVNESPRARFSASTTRGTAPLSVRFDATASSDPDGSVDAYNWTFGDGRTGTGATIEHRYATPGSYSVRLIVADDDGATGSSTIQIVATEVDGRITSALRQNDSYAGARDTKILAAEPEQAFGNDPILEADGGPDEASILAWDLSSIPPTSEVESVELVFTFEDESQSSYEIYEMKRAWVEDETTWNEYAAGQPWQTPGAMGEDDRGSDVLGVLEAEKIVALNEAGIAVVEQWIRDPSTNNGFILEDYESSVDGVRFFSKETTVETDRPQIVVRYRKGSEQQEPEARIAATPAEGEAPLFVRFDGSDSTDPDGTIVTYAWDFGDEITAFGEETTHTFVEAGEYTVTLTLTDNAGNIGTGQVTIRALDPDNAAPIASFSTEIDPDDPTLYTFDARASADPDGQIETYEWDFGDGEMGQGEVVEHRFELGPTYPVTLTVTDDDGASASATLPVVTDTEVFGVPEAFALLDNYPNPFNPTTRLGYALPEQATVTLTVFDDLGRIVAVLVQRQQQPAGTYTLDFDAANLPSGTYFYRLETDTFAETKRMLLLK